MKKSLFIFILFLSSCDRSGSLTLDGKSSYPIESPCGRMTIGGSIFGRTITFPLSIESGSYTINTDSIALSFSETNTISIRKMDVSINRMPTSKKQFHLKPGDVLNMTLHFDKNLNEINGPLTILPCGVIKCNNENLITDTIHIKL